MGSRGPKVGDVGYRSPAPVIDRLLERSHLTELDCFEWQGPVDDKGYGKIVTGSRLDESRKTQRVHRVAYEILVGPIKETLDHTCQNKRCWNPLHLEDVSNAENKKRGGDRMTHCRRGHERNEQNTYVKKDGKRQCRVCKRELARR